MYVGLTFTNGGRDGMIDVYHSSNCSYLAEDSNNKNNRRVTLLFSICGPDHEVILFLITGCSGCTGSGTGCPQWTRYSVA